MNLDELALLYNNRIYHPLTCGSSVCGKINQESLLEINSEGDLVCNYCGARQNTDVLANARDELKRIVCGLSTKPETKAKRYMVFASLRYYPNGGIHDLALCTDSFKDVGKYVKEWKKGDDVDDNVDVWDNEEGKVIYSAYRDFSEDNLPIKVTHGEGLWE